MGLVRHVCQIMISKRGIKLKTLNLNFKAIYIDENKNKMKVICDVTKTKISIHNENNQTILNKVIPDFYYISCKSGKERIGLFNKIYVEFFSENNIHVFWKFRSRS